MPEGLEAEIYRRAAAAVIGRTVESVEIDERQGMASDIRRALPGATIRGADRHGKLVVIALDGAPPLGLHFGMTGRLIVDGVAAIDRLEYASNRDDPKWDRLTVHLDGGGALRVNDPRRWARFTLDPDVDRLGPDFLALTVEQCRCAFARRRAAVKAVLLDQHVVSGFGNLCVDEVLWQAGVAPAAPAGELTSEAIEQLVAAAGEHLLAMLERGGSHRGTIDPEVRAALPPCPRDGAPLARSTVGGRTTVWCPTHQTR